MAQDIFKPRGKTKASQPGAGVASVYPVPVIGTVMNNVDPSYTGMLQVYLSENMDKGAFESDNWIWVKRLAGFAGQTEGIGPSDSFGEYVGNPSSYGQWNAPPDKLTQVICIFVNGDPNYGFYIGMKPKPETLSMIPAIGASPNVTLNEGEASSYGGAPRLPTTNLNVNNKDIANSIDYLTVAKPVHSYTASIMQQQGVLRDKYRGPIGTSATREATSRVGWGVSTPGRPIYEGGFTDEDIASNLEQSPEKYRMITRRGGHSLVMDDGDIIGRDQLIRLRTALGHQILMSDDGQMLSILHSNGQTYIELGKEGTVDVFATNSVNIRTQGDLNLHADNDLNLHAGNNVNINSAANTNLNTDKVFSQRVGEDYNLYAIKDAKIKTDSALAIEAQGQVGIKSTAEIFNEGSKIHLNDGAASLSPAVVEPIDIIKHPDTLFDETKGWAAALAKLPSITSRAPAHMPWMNANQGADVEVDPSASGSLPESPSEELGNLNEGLAGDLGGVQLPLPNPVGAASIDEVGAISGSLDKNATASMLSGIKSKAGGSINGVAEGIGGLTNVVNGEATSATALAVGGFGQTPSQLVSGGTLKPGTDTMINALVDSNAGNVVTDALNTTGGKLSDDVMSSIIPTSAFSGASGVNSVQQYTGSGSAQAQGVVASLQKGQKALQTVGAVTGKEAPGALGSVVAGTGSSLSDKGSLGTNVGTVSGILNKATDGGTDQGRSARKFSGSGAAGDVLSSMKTGATSMMTSAMSGGEGGITSALSTLGDKLGAELPGVGIDLNIGASASSFKSIVNSFPSLEAGVPQDLTAIAGAAAAKIAGASAGMSSADLADPSSITGALSDAVGAGSLGDVAGALTSGTGGAAELAQAATGGATAAITGAVNDVASIGATATSLTNSGGLQNAANKVQRGATSQISSTIASGVSNLPGGQKLAESVVDNAKGSVNAIADGLGPVTDALSSVGASAFSGIDAGGLVAAGESALGNLSDSFGSLTDSLTGDVAGALSGALSPGAAAALKSALSSLTAGGGSTIKLPVVATNTYDRSSITSLISNVLGNPKIPRPNLLGEIPASALSAVASLTALRKTITSDTKALNAASRDVAKKQKAVFEAESNFPAGSLEIVQAKAAYEAAATSPAYINLVNKVKSAEETFKILPIDTDQHIIENTNPFSNIEQELANASSSAEGQAVNTPSATEGIYDPWSVNNNETVLLDQLVSVDQSLYQDNTYTNIYSTITQPPAPIVDTPEDDIVESIISGGPKFGPLKPPGYVPLPPTDGQGGVGQDVYTWWGYNGEYAQYVGVGYEGGYGSGGGVWYWDQSDVTWKHK